MIVANINKKKNNDYDVLFDDGNVYTFDEEVIVLFRLVKGKEIDEDTLNEAIKKNNFAKFYNKALDYGVRYAKSKNAIIDYLIDKGLDNKDANLIADELENKKLINDESLIDSALYSLTKAGNGVLMIENKLYLKGFTKDLINDALTKIDYDLYYDTLEKLYLKCLKRYEKEENVYTKKCKIRRNLMSKGYLLSEIDEISNKIEKM